MLQRIIAILENKGLSATGFADTIGIARPVMSHILSGRNKPSLEVVQKILKAFPDLNIAWVMLGEGQMLRSVDKAPVVQPVPEVKSQPEIPVASKIDKEGIPEKIQNINSAEKQPEPKKAIISSAEKIIVLYSDNTFQEFDKRD